MDLLKQNISNTESMSFAFPINSFFTLYNIDNQKENLIQPIKENLIQPIKENLIQTKKDNLIQPIKENLIQPIKENLIQPIKENLNPIEFIKENIKIGNNDNIIKNIIFKELSNPIFNKKFTKKDISLIQNGLITNKWNISLCKFISFIFDISFIYRKNNIIDNDIVNLKIENYKL
jgi:hypothetical protein